MRLGGTETRGCPCDTLVNRRGGPVCRNRDCPSSQAPILTRGSLKRILRVTALRQWTARVIALSSSGALEIGCAGRDGSNPFVDGAARTSTLFEVRELPHSSTDGLEWVLTEVSPRRPDG